MYTLCYSREDLEFGTLAEAMERAKGINEFVCIKNDDFEVVGKFGVDVIVDGICPDGIEYSWMKRRMA
jgi:hypothetical protein